MCELLDKIEERGEKRGVREASKKILIGMVKKGYTYDQVEDLFPDLSKDELQQLFNSIVAPNN